MIIILKKIFIYRETNWRFIPKLFENRNRIKRNKSLIPRYIAQQQISFNYKINLTQGKIFAFLVEKKKKKISNDLTHVRYLNRAERKEKIIKSSTPSYHNRITTIPISSWTVPFTDKQSNGTKLATIVIYSCYFTLGDESGK